MRIDREALRSSLDRLAAALPAELPVEAVLEEVVTAVRAMFGLAGAGVLVIDEQRALRSMISSDAAAEALEAAQLRTGCGPCIDAFVHDRTVACPDLAREAAYHPIAGELAERGVRAVLGVPIRLGGGPVGSLNVYHHSPHPWSAVEKQALEAYTGLLGGMLQVAVAAEQRGRVVDQLSYALDYRIPIERAVGFLMARHGTDPVDAFNLLRRRARDQRRKVAEVAEALLAGRESA